MPQQGTNYQVKGGDNLIKIAREVYGNPRMFAEIMRLNGLRSGVIQPGMVLKLPAPKMDQAIYISGGPNGMMEKLKAENKYLQEKGQVPNSQQLSDYMGGGTSETLPIGAKTVGQNGVNTGTSYSPVVAPSGYIAQNPISFAPTPYQSATGQATPKQVTAGYNQMSPEAAQAYGTRNQPSTQSWASAQFERFKQFLDVSPQYRSGDTSYRPSPTYNANMAQKVVPGQTRFGQFMSNLGNIQLGINENPYIPKNMVDASSLYPLRMLKLGREAAMNYLSAPVMPEQPQMYNPITRQMETVPTYSTQGQFVYNPQTGGYESTVKTPKTSTQPAVIPTTQPNVQGFYQPIPKFNGNLPDIGGTYSPQDLATAGMTPEQANLFTTAQDRNLSVDEANQFRTVFNVQPNSLLDQQLSSITVQTVSNEAQTMGTIWNELQNTGGMGMPIPMEAIIGGGGKPGTGKKANTASGAGTWNWGGQ